MASSSNRKIRVLEVIYGFGYGGIRAFIMNYLQYLDKDKFDVDIYVFGWDSSPFTDKVHQLGANIYFEPENNATSNIPRFISQLYSFMKRQGPYDVVHAHTNLIGAWVLMAAKIAGVPIRLSHSHSTDHFRNQIVQSCYSHLRRGVVKLLATKKLACGKLAGETMYGKNADFAIIANGISLEKFMHADHNEISKLRDKLNIPEGVRIYANVTRLDSQKNHLFAVDVFKEIHRLDPTAIFVYGGVEPKISSTAEEVKTKISKYGLDEFCRFTGPLMNVENLYHLSDVWIYCSAFEGLPFGPIELQASGVNVLVSDVITKEIDLGLDLVHFLSLDQSPKEWANKAVLLQKQPIDQERIRKAFIENHFDIRQSVKQLELLYQGK